MRICILTTMHPVGDDLVYYKHARSLAKHYGHVTLIAPSAEPPEDTDAPSVDFRWLKASASPIGRLFRLVQAVREVRKLSPDICHFYDLDIVAIVPWLKAACKVGLIYDALEAYPENTLNSLKVPKLLRPLAARCVDVIEKYMARRCSLVITADEATSADFERKQIRTSILFNFPPLHLFEPEPPSLPEIQQRYLGRTIGLYHGSMLEVRGLFEMLKATPLVVKQDRSFLLMLIGLNDGDLKRRAMDLIRELQIENNVEIIPWIPHTEIAAYIRVARVGLIPWHPIPKFFKNIPQKIFEYMACGVPVLGANLPPISHFLQEAGAGVVTDCTKPELLAEGILSILKDESEWLRMSRNGRQAFLTRYNWEAMEPLLFGIYDEFAGLDSRKHE